MTSTARLIALLALCIAAASHAETSPYVAQAARGIKALSSEQIDALRNGRGMGYAMPAELNGYPGPRHVLDLADELALSEAQRDGSQAAFEEMRAAAMPLGEALVEAHTQLEAAFGSGKATAEAVATLALRIGDLEGRLRAVHLAAHLSQHALLSAAQREKYSELRGYGARDAHAGHAAGGL